MWSFYEVEKSIATWYLPLHFPYFSSVVLTESFYNETKMLHEAESAFLLNANVPSPVNSEKAIIALFNKLAPSTIDVFLDELNRLNLVTREELQCLFEQYIIMNLDSVCFFGLWLVSQL